MMNIHSSPDEPCLWIIHPTEIRGNSIAIFAGGKNQEIILKAVKHATYSQL